MFASLDSQTIFTILTLGQFEGISGETPTYNYGISVNASDHQL